MMPDSRDAAIEIIRDLLDSGDFTVARYSDGTVAIAPHDEVPECEQCHAPAGKACQPDCDFSVFEYDVEFGHVKVRCRKD